MPYRVRPVCPRCRRVQCVCAVPYRRGKQKWSNKEERDYKARAVAEWVARYGWVCPGYQVAQHESYELSADHLTPLSWGGDPLGPVQILCKSCNSRRSLETR